MLVMKWTNGFFYRRTPPYLTYYSDKHSFQNAVLETTVEVF
jgi:hypothetical protein